MPWITRNSQRSNFPSHSFQASWVRLCLEGSLESHSGSSLLIRRRIGIRSGILKFSALKLMGIYLFSVLQYTLTSRYCFLKFQSTTRAILSFIEETVSLSCKASLSSQLSHKRHSEDPMPGPVLQLFCLPLYGRVLPGLTS